MSSATWTPGALWPERRRLSGPCWRVVESQHRVSTMKLVDTLEEQELLEVLVESTKPQVPAECRHLHYLLFTPFRYGAPYPHGSRFRRSGLTPGVFYGSQTPAAAIAEMAFHRLLFFAESPGTPWPANAGEYTAFLVEFKTSAALDLTAPPLVSDRPRWIARTNYRACQDLADAARTAGIEVLRYESARAPAPPGGINLALMTCRAFVSRQPKRRQTWRIHLGAHGARALCEFPAQRLGFDRGTFADDPRMAALGWER
jgi:RES domain